MEENTILASAAFGSGRIVATDQSTVPHYYLCDHLGSTRAIVAETDVTETYDYYPYGLTWLQAEQPIGINTYLFTGKEWQAQDGVDLYDFGARFYQSRFGKWLSIDPLAEEYMGISPYAYCGNDPVNRVDPDGMRDDKYYNSLGYLIYDTEDGNRTFVMRPSNANGESHRLVNYISEQEAIDTENKIRQGNLLGDHMQNMIEIESVSALNAMKATIKDDGTGGNSDNNNREYGGIVNSSGEITNVSQGDVRTFGNKAVVHLNVTGARSVYHSHSSGVKGFTQGLGSSSLPSEEDFKAIGAATGYLFQMRTKEIVIFNDKKVQAIVPFIILDN